MISPGRALLAAITLLAGCAQMRWYHASRGDQEFYRDNAQCKVMANSVQTSQIYASAGASPFSQGFASGYNQVAAGAAIGERNTIYEHCMKGNGYYLAPAKR